MMRRPVLRGVWEKGKLISVINKYRSINEREQNEPERKAWKSAVKRDVGRERLYKFGHLLKMVSVTQQVLKKE